MIVVGVLDLFETLLLVELDFVDDWSVEVQRQGVLETKFKLSVALHKRSFLRLDQVALLRNVLIGKGPHGADAAHFTHVGLFNEVNFAADRGHIGGDFQVFARIRTGAGGKEGEKSDTREEQK